MPDESGALRHPAHQDSLRPFNGGSFELPLTFASGIHRGRMNPKDGQLYLTGLKGWVSSAVNDGCFQRVRYVGATDQPQAGALPSPPSLGERARVRGPIGDDTTPLQTDSTLSPSPRRGGSVRGDEQRTTPEHTSSPLTLTLSPEDGGEGTSRTVTHDSQPSVRRRSLDPAEMPDRRSRASLPLASFPLAMQTYRNGIALTFSGPLDREAAEDPSNYQLEAWNYKWSAEYGSPEYKPSAPGQVGRDEIEPKSATLLDDDRTVFIELPNLKPVDQLAVGYTLLTPDSIALEQTVTLTLNSIPDRTMPDDKLHRPQPTNEPPTKLVAGISISSEELLDEQGHRLMAWSFPVASRSKRPAAGPRTIRARAWLRVPTTGDYRFTRDGTGTATVAFHGNQDVRQPLSESTAVSVRLKRGLNEIDVQCELPREGEARFRLLWESVRFPREAVPASSLFRRHPPHDVGAAFWDAFSTGQIAYQQYNCTRCHASSLAERHAGFRKSTPLALRGAPRLDESGRRFSPEWIANWLVDPTRLKHGSVMPKLIPGDDPQMAVDLAAYLGSLNEPASPLVPVSARTDGDDEAARRGSDLFEKLGCIACHRFTEPDQNDEWRRESLHFTKAKYQPDALERFLLAPQRHHATSFMPDFRLSAEEASSLAAFIRQQSRGTVSELAGTQPGNVDRGRKTFEQLRCAQCHTLRPEDKLPPAPLPTVLRGVKQWGCLATEELKETKHARFAFSPETRKALRGYLSLWDNPDADKVEPDPDTTPAHALSETMTSLRCNACHARDEARSLWPEIVAEEGSGRAVEAVPQLTWVGEKLQGPWIEKLLKGELDRRMGTPARPLGFKSSDASLRDEEKSEDRAGKSAHPTGGNASHGNDSPTKPRPWLTARMPSFPAYASVIAHGMAAEHGVPFVEPLPKELDADQVEIGRQLTLRDGGLDCRQCHGIGKEQPRGDASTQIALGINFALARERLRPEFALRQMLDPPRYDIGSRMPRFAPDLRTTAAKHIEGGDARKQFEALKQFLWSVTDE